jgi:ParB-like chromosome segregation protein Spo0J
MIPLDSLHADDAIQPRVALNPTIVAEYAALYADAGSAEAPLPPLDIFQMGGVYEVADGFHRLAAARQAGLRQVRCHVYQGTPREAMLHAAAANVRHGLRYTSGDKERILSRLLADTEIARMADREIARTYGMSHTYVGQVRKRLAAQHQLAEELATVAIRSKKPDKQEKERVAGILGVATADLQAAERARVVWAADLKREIVRRVARGEEYQEVKADLARQVASGAARAAARQERHRQRREKQRVYAERWRKQQDALAHLAAAGGWLEEKLMDLLHPESLARLLHPCLPDDALPTAEALGSMLWNLKQQAAGALERACKSTRKLDTRPQGALVQEILALIREARGHQRALDERERPYPSTFEEWQALRSHPFVHRN